MSEVTISQNQTVSVGEWIIAYILLCLPIVGIVMTFIWAFGAEAKQSKKNWARAMLILMLVGIILSIIFSVALSALLVSIVDNMQA